MSSRGQVLKEDYCGGGVYDTQIDRVY